MIHIPTAIDLYHYDAITSFADVAKAGIERVIHKASEGTTETDPLYEIRQPEALDAGLKWEAYHFWRPDSPTLQAGHYLSVATGASQHWLDYEESGGTPATIISLMEIVDDATGGAMGLYTTKSLAESLAEDATAQQKAFLALRPLWLAEPGVKKPAAGKNASLIWPTISLWQYTWSGKIAGVSGKCDLNCIPA